MKTIGLSGIGITSAIPPAGAYNIEKHIGYLQAIDKIEDVISNAATIVTPINTFNYD